MPILNEIDPSYLNLEDKGSTSANDLHKFAPSLEVLERYQHQTCACFVENELKDEGTILIT